MSEQYALADTKARHTLTIRDIRLSSGRLKLTGDAEMPRDTVSVVMVELDVNPRRTSYQTFPVVSVQRHAIQRWNQRSFSPTDEALREALAQLAGCYDEAVRQTGQSPGRTFNINGWRGEAGWQSGPSVDQSLLLIVRTFLPTEMIAAA